MATAAGNAPLQATCALQYSNGLVSFLPTRVALASEPSEAHTLSILHVPFTSTLYKHVPITSAWPAVAAGQSLVFVLMLAVTLTQCPLIKRHPGFACWPYLSEAKPGYLL